MGKQTVLIVDDEPAIRYALTRMLRALDVEVVAASDGVEGLEKFAEAKPDLVLLDVMMPRMNGFEVCERLKSSPDTRLTPVVIVTSSSAAENRVRGIELGADDFLTKPFDRAELNARVRSLLRFKGFTDELERAETVLLALAKSIEGKDPSTEGHCERLSLYGERLGRRLCVSEDDIVALRRGGIIHDIGKVAVPDAILLKPGKLTEEEFAVIRQHPVIGEQICSGLKSFQPVLPIIRHHHEKLDGTGYPDGLSGEQIPRVARIMTIVDVFDALTTERPYREALSLEKALAIMQEEVARGWWDPEIFAEFRSLVQDEGFLLSAVEASVSDIVRSRVRTT